MDVLAKSLSLVMAKRRSDSLPIPPVTAKKPRSHPTRWRRVVVDRLSQLPDALLVTILSLLPIKDAAGTSVLYCRIHAIWTTCPSLEIARAEFRNCSLAVEEMLREVLPKEMEVNGLH
ncbi:hypothetical protein FCM35_KLT13468 [Carex littledalei]|uniref:F-box domain-containing protein n=1 Tax=Carex littledalei TaxID=544730 RepID=A0A833QIU7_9POAL|nr:hypothetical protein FCM35_KLT13468 [Carex littledalei]